MRRAYILLGVLWAMLPGLKANGLTIEIRPYEGYASQPIVVNAVQDVWQLLLQAGATGPTSELPDVVLEIAAPQAGADTMPTSFAQGRNYPYFHYPAHGFTWTSSGLGYPASQVLTLTAPSPQGIANGLYALLQEKLGFKFIHARQTIVPKLDQWPKNLFSHSHSPTHSASWSGRPRFDKKMFSPPHDASPRTHRGAARSCIPRRIGDGAGIHPLARPQWPELL